jgi:hypothetical protein
MYPVMLGSGVNLYGMYMFQGGQNPQGKLSTLQESQRTGYPTDVPVKSYDFQAPLSAYGEERESFRKLKMVDYFLNDFGHLLAPMEVHAPTVVPEVSSDLSVVRMAVRSSGKRGFVFVNNYVRGSAMPARKSIQIEVALPEGKIVFPDTPIDVPSGAYFIWPFHLALGADELRYSTAQLMMKLSNSKSADTFVFFCVKKLRCEFSFVDKAGLEVQSSAGTVKRDKGSVVVSALPSVGDTILRLSHGENLSARILVLTEEHAENAWRAKISNEDRVLISSQQFLADENEIKLESVDAPRFEALVFPALGYGLSGSSAISTTSQGEFTKLVASVPAVHPHVMVEQLRQAGEAPSTLIGPAPTWRTTGVAEIPADESFAAISAEWKLRIDAPRSPSVSEMLLQVNYKGDVARLFHSAELLDDNFYNGQEWQVGLKRFLPTADSADLRLEVLPLRSDSPIFLEYAVRRGLPVKEQVELLRSVHVLPKYRLTITTATR